MEAGYVVSTNGSGMFWSHHETQSRLRTGDLEVLVPTGWMGTYSANLAGSRCRACGTILLTSPKSR
jgi:hypothetical protein